MVPEGLREAGTERFRTISSDCVSTPSPVHKNNELSLPRSLAEERGWAWGAVLRVCLPYGESYSCTYTALV